MIKFFIEKVDSKYGIDPAAGNNYAIRSAASEGYVDVVKYFIEEVDTKYGIDPAAGNNEAICLAAARGHLDVVKYLMSLDSKYGIDPAAQNNEAIRTTISPKIVPPYKYRTTYTICGQAWAIGAVAPIKRCTALQ